MEKVPNITKKQLLPFRRKSWRAIRAYLDSQKKALGRMYNNKNIYEQICRRFCDPAKDTEKIFNEYMLCLNKASKQPASIREVVLEIGGRAVSMYLEKRKERLEKRRLQRKQRKEKK